VRLRPAWGMVLLWKLRPVGFVFVFFFIYFRPCIADNAIRGGLSKMGWNMEIGGWEKPGEGRHCELLARSTTLLNQIDT
jgi:hypothetical protein